MREIWITKAGAPEVLKVKESPDPEPRAGEVRIRVGASGVNFADIMGRMGLYPDAPGSSYVPGYEVGGTIDKVGDGVDAALVGKKVLAMVRFGAYSDVVCVPEIQAVERPAAMSDEEAAAIPVNYLTAWQLMFAMGSLKEGETVLIHSAGGGVGIAAIQLAKHRGAKIIGTASKGKHEYLKEIGVDHLIDYRNEDFEKRVGEITKGRGVELILDAVGGDSFKKGFRVLAPTGRLGMFGMSSAANSKKRSIIDLLRFVKDMPWFQFNPVALMNENKSVFGVNMGHMWDEAALIRSWLTELNALYEQGIIKPKVDATFTFDEAAKAHHYIQDRRNLGKVVLVP